MELESILVAVITGVCAVIGQWLIARENKRKSDTEQAVKDALMAQRLDSIEGKLDEQAARITEHNNYGKRFEEVAVSLAELRTELKLRGQS